MEKKLCYNSERLKDIWYPVDTAPRLADVRGKMLLMVRPNTGLQSCFQIDKWEDNSKDTGSSIAYIQDWHDVNKEDIDEKEAAIEAFMQKTSSSEADSYYLNFLIVEQGYLWSLEPSQ